MTRRSQPPYPPELRERAVRMVAEIRDDYDSLWGPGSGAKCCI
jgi:transposase